MSMKSGTTGVLARQGLFTLWTAAVSGLAVAALIMSAMALSRAVPGEERVALPAEEKAVSSGSVISGTGPGLIRVADESRQTATLPGIYSGSAVTGTGPGLSAVATESTRSAALLRIYSRWTVTGTGPGLAAVAGDRQVPQVTGTGPGLVQVAQGTRAEP